MNENIFRYFRRVIFSYTTAAIMSTGRKESASQIQRSETISTPGPGVARGGRAATAQSVAGGTVSHILSQEARQRNGGAAKGGPAATAQSVASHTPMFPKNW